MKEKRWKLLALLVICVGLMSFGSVLVSGAELRAGSQAFTTDQLNMRKTNSADGQWIRSIPRGMSVEVKKRMSNNWYKVFYEGKTGYVNGKYLCDTAAASKKYKVVIRKAAAGLNLRQKASGSSKILRVVKDGAEVALLASSDGNPYCKVSHMGYTGYVLRGFFTVDATTKMALRRLNFRKQPKKSAALVDGVSAVPKGAKVTCFKTSGDWWYIKYKNKLGYVIGGSFREQMTTAKNVWIREKASAKGELVVAVPKGKTVTAYSYMPGKDWCLIAYGANKGYVRAEYLKSITG